MKTIDWNKLVPYSGDNKKSFEELCYQIVSEKYKEDIANGATLTSIDDCGGGDGIEFYLTLKNGDIYGWQAKFICRLSEGGRKEQIKTSLHTSYKKHPELKKWFLCSKCNFTPDEKLWFDNKLVGAIKKGETVLPEGHNVELMHWGESELLTFLKELPAIHKFFFSEKLLTQEWFEERYKADIQKSQIKARYESKIHIPTKIDDAINKVLCGDRLIEILEKEMENQQIEMYAKDYEDTLLKLFSEDVRDEYKNIQKQIRIFLHDKANIIRHGIDQLQEIKKVILNKNEKEFKNKVKEFEKYTDTLRNFYHEYNTLTESDLCKPIQYLRDGYEELSIPEEIKVEKSWLIKSKSLFKRVFKNKDIQAYKTPLPIKESEEVRKENNKREDARNILFAPLYELRENAIPSLEWCLNVFELSDQNELHISGEAGMGKTHISFNIYEDQIIQQEKPAIFVFAKDLSTNQPLENQLKDNFTIPVDWSFNDYLGALEIAAKVNKAKIPIIIDGLNESTHWDSVWKKCLENLIIKIKTYYPHIVLITTYRTSYEDQLFPDTYFDYRSNKGCWKLKVNVQGFEDLTWDVVKTYLGFYKIKLDYHSNAIGYFEHPLYLKLFCETKNPNRDIEVKVSFQNEDLFEVFDEYIKNSNKNITSSLEKIDPKYNSDFTENKLLQLSQYLWDNNTRGIPRSNGLLTDPELRAFEGENLLIFKDWNRKTSKEEIQFTYDLLGGYFVSKYLIKSYQLSYPYIKINPNSWLSKIIKTGLEFFIPERGSNLLEKWISRVINKKNSNGSSLLRFIKSKEFRRKLLDSKTQHPLFDDVLRTISVLLIKKDNIFLFDILKSDRANQYSTESLFEINAKYIKENEALIITFLKTEYLSNNVKAYHIIDLAKNVELDVNHPLNFNLWSDLLNDLSMPDRDLLWSEYIRKNHSWYGESHFSNYVKNLEDVCKKECKLSNRVHLAAKKIMWILTSSIRKLRDEATRALYYYARKYPKDFLDLLKYSFGINDPYVIERMLAVSYGLAMARRNDSKDESYQTELLPQYGKLLFDSLFSVSAKHTTTHILARDYAKRTIDIALLHHPDLLVDSEKKMIKYPLKKYAHQGWKEDEDRNKGEYRDGNAPIHMDFRNYTIGRLIKDRRNYDSEHKEYAKVLSQIYWRIYDLGYSLEKFGEIDKQIASDRWNYSRHENIGKTDRYGKKYSWIAFYEMSGYRSDLGLLKGWDDEDEFRISDVDIDPSFPIGLRQHDLFKNIKNNNYLGNEKQSPDSWYEDCTDLNMNEYLHIQDSLGIEIEYECVLLKGSISQKDKDDQTRDMHISINAVLVNSDDFKKISNLINDHDDYTFEYLRNVENHYLFEGEIPWCDLMPKVYTQDFRIAYNYRDVEKNKKELKILNKGKELVKNEVENLREKESEYLQKILEISSEDKSIKLSPYLIDNYKESAVTKKIAEGLGYSVTYIDMPYLEKESNSLEISLSTTIYQNSWESYHSEVIPSGETQVPSKEISDKWELFIKPQSSDIYNKDGELVSTSFKHGKDNETVFTYIRKDYLDKYLKEINKKILWLQWSEKRYFPNGVKKLTYEGEREMTEYRTYYKIIV